MPLECTFESAWAGWGGVRHHFIMLRVASASIPQRQHHPAVPLEGAVVNEHHLAFGEQHRFDDLIDGVGDAPGIHRTDRFRVAGLSWR